jgi:hypothetical protein
MFYFGWPGCECAFGDLGADQPFLGACFGDVGADSKLGNFKAQTVDVVVLNPCRVRWSPGAGIRQGHATIIAPGRARRTGRRDWRAEPMFGGLFDD